MKDNQAVAFVKYLFCSFRNLRVVDQDFLRHQLLNNSTGNAFLGENTVFTALFGHLFNELGISRIRDPFGRFIILKFTILIN